MSAYNNNTTFNTNSNTASTGLNNQLNQQPGQLNENHGIAATGLNSQHGLNSSGAQHQGGLSGASHDIKNIGTNRVTNNSLDHGRGTSGISNTLHQDHHKAGVPVPSHGVNSNQHLNNTHHDTHNTGTAFAGTAATLGAVGQPDTQSRTANHLGHTGQPKTHQEIDDLASSRPPDYSRSPGAAGIMGADEISKHTINNNKGGAGTHGVTGSNAIANNSRRTDDPYTTSTGSDLTGASALQSNAPGTHGHNHHHGVGAAAAGTGATALGAHEHNHHNNHHTTGTHVPGTDHVGNTTGLGTQGNKHGLTHNDHHRTGPSGVAGAGAAAFGAHEHHKHNTQGLSGNHHTTTTGTSVPGTGPAGTSSLDPRDNKHGLTNSDHHCTGPAGVAGAGAAALGAHEHHKQGLANNAQHPTVGAGVHDRENNTLKHAGGGVSAIRGDHGASLHTKHDPANTKRNSIKDDLKARGEEPGVHDSRGVRHAGVPLHEGLAPVHDYDQEHLNNSNPTMSTTDTKPSAGDKIKGNLEKIAGKITGNEEKVVKGDNLAHGRAI